MIKNWSLMLAVTLLTTLLAGCLQSSRAITNAALVDPSQQYSPTESVDLLDTRPQRPFYKIGFLETMADEKTISDVMLLENMRAKAAAIGAHAIVVERNSMNTFDGGDVYRVLRGMAIRYKDGNNRPVAARPSTMEQPAALRVPRQLPRPEVRVNVEPPSVSMNRSQAQALESAAPVEEQTLPPPAVERF